MNALLSEEAMSLNAEKYEKNSNLECTVYSLIHCTYYVSVTILGTREKE